MGYQKGGYAMIHYYKNEKSTHQKGFIIVTARVRYDKEISAHYKYLYGEIATLSYLRGYCEETNVYFSKFCNVERRTIARWLKILVDHFYIKIDKSHPKRRIYPLLKKDLTCR